MTFSKVREGKMQGLIGKYLQAASEALAWFAPVSAYALLPMLIPVLVVGAGAAFTGWNAPPHTLAEITGRLVRGLSLFGVLFLEILGLFVLALAASPAVGVFTPAFAAFVVLPLVACWLFALVWRLGYDLGLLCANIHAAKCASERRPAAEPLDRAPTAAGMAWR